MFPGFADLFYDEARDTRHCSMSDHIPPDKWIPDPTADNREVELKIYRIRQSPLPELIGKTVCDCCIVVAGYMAAIKKKTRI